MIRGVRVIKLNPQESNLLNSVLDTDKGLYIYVFVIGTNEYGTTYSSMKGYPPNSIKKGYGFAAIRRSTNVQDALTYMDHIRDREKKKLSTLQHRKEQMRYQHFDKLYKTGNYHFGRRERNVLTLREMAYGEYHGPRRWLSQLLNYIMAAFLGR